jgi:hypothetical protein
VPDLFPQHAWPPRDPDRDGPIRPLPDPTSNPFTYGESFNPALTPSNAVLRSRSRQPASPNSTDTGLHHSVNEHDIGKEHYSSGEERDRCGEESSSDRYLSGTDDSADESFSGGEGSAGGVRLRRGSEGYEVRAITSWNWMDQLEQPYEVGTEASGEQQMQ